MFALTTPIVLAGALVLVVVVGLWRRLDLGRLAAVAIFAVYLVGAAHFVLLPLEYDPELARAVGPIDLARLIEQTPFFFPGGDALSQDQLLLNVLLTVPFGFGLPFVRDARGREVLLIGFVFSLGIELAQLTADALYLALPTWSVDINDVLLNSLGVAIGYGAFRVVSAAYAGTLGRLPVGRGPWAHFHEALAHSRSGS